MASKKLLRLNILFPIITLVFVVGCATQSPKPLAPAETQETLPPPVSESLESETAGDSAENALVEQQLGAVEALLEQYQIKEAQIIVNGLIYSRLDVHQKTRYVLIQAEMNLLMGEGQLALEWLTGEYVYLFDGLPLDHQINISLMRSQAYEFSGLPLSAARERIFLAPLLDEDQAQRNQDQIWFDLQLVDEDQLRLLAETESSPDLTGWINLSLIGLTQSEDLYRLLVAVENWQKQNRAHPASKNLPGSLKMLRELATKQPKHIGVLLPLSGRLEKVGNAVRNGLISAWYQSQRYGLEPPELRFYDTSVVEDVQNLYKQAVINGAETIIGPLSKTKVQRLSLAAELPVPVLALNYADTRLKKINNFYQFGLAPEDEAIQVAEDIWQQGIRNVLVIAPKSDWGARVSDKFVRSWQLKGGTISNKAMFNPTKTAEYLGSIKTALNITDSEKRHALLQKVLDEKLVFETRRRQDIDLVFMLAYPAQARQLKPILDYQKAIEIPVVATSHIYSGKQDKAKDQDLRGIHFVEMPWRLASSSLKQEIYQAFPDSSASKLVAFGIDAYRLFPRLPQMSAFNDVRVQGVTGAMSMSGEGKIVRKLDWATIEKGIAQYASSSDILE